MHVFYGIAKTIMDGTKDADQQYDFAVAAKAEGKPEIAAKHIEEAKKRLAGVDAVMELLMQHHRASLDKIAQFKPGA